MHVDHPVAISPMTEHLQRCLERILELEHVAPQDNFFELGGDSLAAAQLMVEIEERFRVKVPGSILLQHPTCATLAAAIEQSAGTASRAAVVPIRETGHLPPVFVTYVQDGNLWFAHNLAPHLSPDQPLYGVAPGVTKPTFRHFEDLALQSVEVLIAAHPQPDYRLLGYSFGGILAFEMARCLLAKGYRVSFLGIVDAPPMLGPERRPRKRREQWQRLADRLRRDGLLKTFAWSFRWLDRRIRNDSTNLELPRNRGAQSLFEKRALHAFFRHVPGIYTGDIIFFQTEGQRLNRGPDEACEWAAFTSGRVEVIPVAGDHVSIGKGPDIVQIANWLNSMSSRNTPAFSPVADRIPGASDSM